MAMKTKKIVTFSLALAALGLGGIVSQATLPAAYAQDGQDPQAPPPPMGQQGPGGGGFGGGQGGFGGGRQGGGRQGMVAGGGRFAIGTVSAVDPAARTITVTSPFAGTQTIQVSDTTQLVSQATATVADLKVGDKVQVQGVPTGITASTLTIGDNPLAAGGGGGRQGGIAGAGRQGGGGQGGFGGGPGAQPASASATGTVTATSPLTISLSTSVTLTLKLASDAKVTRYAAVPLSGIKVGDQIVSTGQAGDGGVFAATTVGVNMQMGGGRGGFGGGGFGGGGFGGGQGGRGRRGGQGGGGFGGPQGGGAPMPAPDPNA